MRSTILALAAAAGLTLAACGSDASSPEELCPSPTDATTVEMADFSYSPTCASVEEGSSLEIRNTGQAPHTFTVDGTDVDVEVDPGGSTTVDLANVAAGTYEVICTLHPQMQGALRVA